MEEEKVASSGHVRAAYKKGSVIDKEPPKIHVGTSSYFIPAV
jgi:hypothetical protein